jgi:hypothetical protein
MISGMNNSPVAPVKCWNRSPTSAAASRKIGEELLGYGAIVKGKQQMKGGRTARVFSIGH